MLTAELQEQIRQRKPEIMALLKSAEALATQERAIVPLQPNGARIPIFGVAGHNGDVFCYRSFVQHLGDDQPFFGLQPPGLDGESKPLESIEALGGYFAQQVRAFKPEGPYIVTGFCAGGSIALELAQQLRRQGAEVRFLALFGSPFATAYRFLPTMSYLVQFNVARVMRKIREWLSPSYRERRMAMAAGLARSQAERARVEPGDPVTELRAHLEEVTLGGLRRYTPRPFDGRLLVFLPSRSFRTPGNAMRRWRTLSPASEEFVGPDDCEGDFMLLEPNVGMFAELFRRARDVSAGNPPGYSSTMSERSS